ncbi:MbcA/ParS/Xre antitoxin family protein [Xenophilus aerolatus]|nr:MbcA/ParS/Xre antitoxin family protein [Xenophilus aerolatus]
MSQVIPTLGENREEVLAEIRRLEATRAVLVEQKMRAQAEELKVLADAYARKLQAASLSIREGIAALRPYEKSMSSKCRQASTSSRQAVDGMSTSPLPQLQAQARTVFGDDAEQWLVRPHPLLGGRSPRDAAAQPEGLEKIQALLTA